MNKFIHLIWFGEINSEVDRSVMQHTALNPNRVVWLHRDMEHLNEKYKRLLKYAKPPQLQSDLLRWSLLEKFGGWYFDIDIVPIVPVQHIENELNLDGSKMFLTSRRGFPNNDIIYVKKSWKFWERIHNYLNDYSIEGEAIWYSCFSLDVICKALIGPDDCDRWILGPPKKFCKSESAWAYRKCEDI